MIGVSLGGVWSKTLLNAPGSGFNDFSMWSLGQSFRNDKASVCLCGWLNNGGVRVNGIVDE